VRDAADDRQVAGAQTLPHTTVAAMDLSTWTPDFSTQFGALGNFADFSFSAPKICPPTGQGAASGPRAVQLTQDTGPFAIKGGAAHGRAPAAPQNVDAAASGAAFEKPTTMREQAAATWGLIPLPVCV
jgi:hypothetical protein